MQDDYSAEQFAAEQKLKGRNASTFLNGANPTPLSTVIFVLRLTELLRIRPHLRDAPAVHAGLWNCDLLD